MSKFDYEARQTVRAYQWREDNLEDMKELLKDVVDSNPWDGIEVYVDEVDPYFINYRGKTHANPGCKILKFYAGDDMEVDPGRWVVVYEDGEIEIMDDFNFTRCF